MASTGKIARACVVSWLALFLAMLLAGFAWWAFTGDAQLLFLGATLALPLFISAVLWLLVDE